jgi:streptomycin 6-kinase
MGQCPWGVIPESWRAMADVVLHTGQPLPPAIVQTVRAWDQEQLTPGWLASLPEIVRELCAQWAITLDPVIPDTYVTLVLLGHSAELGPVVIKSSPLAVEFRAEVTALRLAEGAHMVRLYDVDLARSAMVIERIVPGTQLRHAALSDEDATRLAAETVATMWRPVRDPASLHPLHQWMQALFDAPPRSEQIPRELLQRAQALGHALLGRSSPQRLLHGDLQHHNLLQRASGDWVIIDPKGLVGPPGFEIAAWMYNPPGVADRDDYAAVVGRRAEICATVWGIDRHELIEWAFVGTMLNACWCARDPAPEAWLAGLLRGAGQIQPLLT